MLRTMRDSMKYLQWTLWVVVAVFILFVFVDFGGFMPGDTGGAPAKDAVTVGDHGISWQDFRREYQALEARYRDQLGENFDREALGARLPQQAIERLITQRILVDEAERLGLRVTDRELREAVLDIPGMRDENGRFIGKEAYGRFLRSIDYTPEAFERAMRNDLLVQRFNQALQESVYVSASAVERSDRERSERVSLRFVELPWTEADPVEVSDAALAAYFEEHREEYRLPERRVVDALIVERAKLVDAISPSDAKLQAFYEAHREDFTQQEQVSARHILINTSSGRDASQAEALANELRARIEAGEDFAVLAAQHSDDVSNRERGGDLGSFGRGRMVPAFEEAVFAAQPGQLVGPVRTQFGYHLIEVLDRREERVRPFEEVRSLVMRRVQTEQAGEQALAQAEALAKRIAADQIKDHDAFLALAEGEEAVSADTTQPFGRDDGIPALGRVPELLQAAFDLPVGGISAPVSIPRGAVILRLAEIQDPRLPELDEVRGRVVAATRLALQKEQALEKVRQAAARLGDGSATLDQLAAELGLTVRETGEFGAGTVVPQIGQAEALVDQALALEMGAVGEPYAADRGAILYTVASRTHWDQLSFADRAESLRQNLEFQELQRLLMSLVAERRRELGVSYDRQLVQELDLLGEDQAPKT